MLELLEPRILLALSMLAVASFTDLRSREVNDVIWIAFGSVGAILYIIAPLNITDQLPPILTGLGITLVIAYVAYKLGLFAGADALAIVALVVIMPVYDTVNMFHKIAPLTILTNASVFATSSVVLNIARNITALLKGNDIFAGFNEPLYRKAVAFIIGYRADKAKFSYIIETRTPAGKKFDFTFKHAENVDYAIATDSWAMMGLPFIVYLLAGFIAMIITGDILYIILDHLF